MTIKEKENRKMTIRTVYEEMVKRGYEEVEYIMHRYYIHETVMKKGEKVVRILADERTDEVKRFIIE